MSFRWRLVLQAVAVWVLLACAPDAQADPFDAPSDDSKRIADGEHGVKTGWIHRVRARWRSTRGLEAGIPRNSWYGKAMRLDQRGSYDEAYNAYYKAERQFRDWLRQRPHDAKRIRGWLLKAQHQRGITYSLKRQKYYRSSYYYQRYYYRHRAAKMRHQKYLALRAFGLQPKRTLLKASLKNYREALRLRSVVEARLELAALLYQVGRIREARDQFTRAQPHINKTARYYNAQWMPLAYFYAVSGQHRKAFDVLKKLTHQSWRKRQILQSNYFDSLRGDRRFKTVVGEP
jgi:tetratricopeptide (TPR) repeat protein